MPFKTEVVVVIVSCRHYKSNVPVYTINLRGVIKLPCQNVLQAGVTLLSMYLVDTTAI